MIRLEFKGNSRMKVNRYGSSSFTPRTYIYLNPDQVDYICINSFWQDHVEHISLEIYLTSRCIIIENKDWSLEQLKEIEKSLIKAIRLKFNFFEVDRDNTLTSGKFDA